MQSKLKNEQKVARAREEGDCGSQALKPEAAGRRAGMWASRTLVPDQGGVPPTRCCFGCTEKRRPSREVLALPSLRISTWGLWSSCYLTVYTALLFTTSAITQRSVRIPRKHVRYMIVT